MIENERNCRIESNKQREFLRLGKRLIRIDAMPNQSLAELFEAGK